MKIQINTQVSSSTFLRVIPFLEKEEISFSASNGVSVNVKSPIFSGKKWVFLSLKRICPLKGYRGSIFLRMVRFEIC